MGPGIAPFFIVPPHATLGLTSLLASLSLRTGPLGRGGNEALRSGRAEARKANTPVRHCLILTEGLLEREIRHELSGAEGGCCGPLSATSLFVCSGASIDLLVLGRLAHEPRRPIVSVLGRQSHISPNRQSLVFTDPLNETLELADLSRLSWPSSVCLVLCFFPT